MRYKNLYYVKPFKKDVGKKIKGPLRPNVLLPNEVSNYKDINDEQKIHYSFLGHSSIFLKIDKLNILIDPCFKSRLLPIGFKRYLNFSPTSNDFPTIDVILITHNHYDHLDIETLLDFDEQTKYYVVPLGIKKFLIKQGFSQDKIIELHWYEDVSIDGLNVTCTPASHNSMRSLFDRDNTLWCSYVLEHENYRLFHSGDTAFSKHFLDIHRKFTNFDLSFIECGQYGAPWHDSHMFPEESVEAALSLNSKLSIPIHWGAYTLSCHPYEEPTIRFKQLAEKHKLNYFLPEIYKIY